MAHTGAVLNAKSGSGDFPDPDFLVLAASFGTNDRTNMGFFGMGGQWSR